MKAGSIPMISPAGWRQRCGETCSEWSTQKARLWESLQLNLSLLYQTGPSFQVMLHSVPKYKGAKLRLGKNSNKVLVYRKEYLDFITRTGEHNWSQGVVVRMNRNWCNIAWLEALPILRMILQEFLNSCLQQASFLSEHTFLPLLHSYHFSTSE